MKINFLLFIVFQFVFVQFVSADQYYPEFCSNIDNSKVKVKNNRFLIKSIQVILGNEGYGYLSANGIYDKPTQLQVGYFQKMNGLRISGVLTKSTLYTMKKKWCGENINFNNNYSIYPTNSSNNYNTSNSSTPTGNKFIYSKDILAKDYIGTLSTPNQSPSGNVRLTLETNQDTLSKNQRNDLVLTYTLTNNSNFQVVFNRCNLEVSALFHSLENSRPNVENVKYFYSYLTGFFFVNQMNSFLGCNMTGGEFIAPGQSKAVTGKIYLSATLVNYVFSKTTEAELTIDSGAAMQKVFLQRTSDGFKFVKS